jgi:hypothetical protein
MQEGFSCDNAGVDGAERLTKEGKLLGRQRAWGRSPAADALGEAQEGVRTDQGRHRFDALGAVEAQVLQREVLQQMELGLLQLRHQVVVVRVEPLRQLQCGFAPRHGEVGLQSGVCSEALRNCPHHDGGVQHGVVERELVAGNQVHCRVGGGALELELGNPFGELCWAELTAPEALQQRFVLAPGAQAREAKGKGVHSLLTVE